MTIAVGEKLPDIKLQYKAADGIVNVDKDALFASKRVVIFAVPGAFTPTCSDKHLPSFVQNVDNFKACGIATIACLAVNDPFVMYAWGKNQCVDEKIMMLADGSGEFTKKIGMELDLTHLGLGVRSQRYAMVVSDSIISHLFIDPMGSYQLSSAENVLQNI
ncbi:Peroxiredoxin family protein [Candidatus Endolissoclinum faulkneri L2]|uniref:Glutathione-dependent peroxiredoxin n=1 Tax=Candidatus Endolissoclinum faulkneri L2 TaxID=1193729 RepID=K7YLW7_9PROT|nr:peroxiredoxin [Candidatus Endolissoclinum faulkneri]AFX98467.1 Peroxiredoxin family protein [Candidatus Endolissoclinum faulkneri L2]